MRARESGFTLLELLVSLFILALTAAMLMAGMVTVRQVAERSARQAATGESIVTAQTILRERMENIVSFFAPAPPAQRPSTVARYRLVRTAPGDIVLYSVSDLSDRVNAYAPGEAGWTPTVLLTGVEALEMGYYGAAPPDSQRRWRTQWVERQQPPELIRVRIAFKPGVAGLNLLRVQRQR
jgi:general secretion pathway protein J